MMVLLNIDEIAKIKEYAEANPLTEDDMLDMMNGYKPMAGDTEGHYYIDPFGTKIVFSIDYMEKYKLRHLSISMDNGKTMPHPVFVLHAMQLLGFKKQLFDCHVEVERRGVNGSVQILNVAEIIE